MDASSSRDIVIIGGGIIGCCTAYFITRHPSFNPAKHRVTILEASQIAGGASGKAGGLLALWAYPSSLVPLSFRLHAELAAQHDGAARWGYRRLGVGQINCRGRPLPTGGEKPKPDGDGNVSLGKLFGADEAKALRAAGLPSDLDWIAPAAKPSYQSMGSPEDTAQVHPYQFTTSMAALAEEKGAHIVLGSATDIHRSAAGAVESVRYRAAADGSPTTLAATDVVICAGPWTQRIYPRAPISALRAHSVVIRPTRPLSAYALFTSIAMPAYAGGRAQHASPEIYARPRGEVYACGEGDRRVPLPDASADVAVDARRCRDIVEQVGSISDELRDGEVLVRQACYLPSNEGGQGGPLVGPTGEKGVFIAAGHTCWGIQNGPGTGKLMAEYVMEGKAKSAKIGGLDPRKVL